MCKREERQEVLFYHLNIFLIAVLYSVNLFWFQLQAFSEAFKLHISFSGCFLQYANQSDQLDYWC